MHLLVQRNDIIRRPTPLPSLPNNLLQVRKPFLAPTKHGNPIFPPETLFPAAIHALPICFHDLSIDGAPGWQLWDATVGKEGFEVGTGLCGDMNWVLEVWLARL